VSQQKKGNSPFRNSIRCDFEEWDMSESPIYRKPDWITELWNWDSQKTQQQQTLWEDTEG